MKTGDVLPFAWWLTGTETQEDLKDYAEAVKDAIAGMAVEEGIVFSKPVARTIYPGDEQAPPVPDHIFGPDVRMIITEVRIDARLPGFGPGLFVGSLGPDDLRLLRRITRKSYARRFPGRIRLTDRQCDTLIDDYGPEAAADAIRAGEAKLVFH